MNTGSPFASQRAIGRKEHGISDPTDLNLGLEIRDGGKKYLRPLA